MVRAIPAEARNRLRSNGASGLAGEEDAFRGTVESCHGAPLIHMPMPPPGMAAHSRITIRNSSVRSCSWRSRFTCTAISRQISVIWPSTASDNSARVRRRCLRRTAVTSGFGIAPTITKNARPYCSIVNTAETRSRVEDDG